MTKIEALRLEADAREMVEGTGLHWLQVIRNTKTKVTLDYISDTCWPDRNDLELALRVLEGKPVWKDESELWFTYPDGRTEKFIPCAYHRNSDVFIDWRAVHYGPSSSISWNPPKAKTVMVELPVLDAKIFAEAYEDSFPSVHKNIAEACRKALEG